MKTMPSLLAPAGNMRALQTALRFGADAPFIVARNNTACAHRPGILTKSNLSRLSRWRMRRALRSI